MKLNPGSYLSPSVDLVPNMQPESLHQNRSGLLSCMKGKKMGREA